MGDNTPFSRLPVPRPKYRLCQVTDCSSRPLVVAGVRDGLPLSMTEEPNLPGSLGI
jgi:hypothetical protein